MAKAAAFLFAPFCSSAPICVTGFVEQVEQAVNPLASLRGGNDVAISRNECFAPALQVLVTGFVEQVEQTVSFHVFHSW